jgi:hypothetical protein
MSPHRLHTSSRIVLALCAAASSVACDQPLPATGTAGSTTTPPVVERPFSPAGRINMHLSAGKYIIQGSPDQRIHLSAQTREPGDAGKVRLDIQAAGDEATVRSEGPSNGFQVAIAVPARSDLWIRLSAGDLTILGVEGHKDVSAWAGELTFAVGDGAGYRAVETSVLAGEIQAPALKGGTGGVFRSFSWKGSGQYDLRARLTAGEIRLREN